MMYNGLFLLEIKAKVTLYQWATSRLYEDFLSPSFYLHLKQFQIASIDS